MKGIIFNLLEDVVRREYGQDTWETILETTKLEGSYTSLGNYPDEDLGKIVVAASSALGTPTDEIVRWFGRRAIPLLAEKFPSFFKPNSARTFLLTLNDIIHTEVLKIYPGSVVPIFDYDTSSQNVLVMGYRSNRRLCSLAEGFIEGAADYYEETVSVEQQKCMKRGDDKCLLRITLRKQGA
jgi:hypothetical protein